MEYKLAGGKKKINLRRFSVIDTSGGATVYKYNNRFGLRVYKADNNNARLGLSEAVCKKLCAINNSITINNNETKNRLEKINPQRIILPLKPLYADGKYMGYNFRLPEKDSTNHKIIDQDIVNLVEELMVVEKNIDVLSDEKVLLNDIKPYNVTYNGKIFINNPDSFAILDKIKTNYLNYEQFHILMTDIILNELSKDNVALEDMAIVEDKLRDKMPGIPTSIVVGEKFGNDSTIKEYVKKLGSKH